MIVVALAGSGAEPGSIVRFLNALKGELGAALVLVLQHREALSEEAFAKAIEGRWTPTPVEDGARLEPGRLYLPPPDAIATLDGERFRLRSGEHEPGGRNTIDSFLVSLSEAKLKAVAVLFAATGGDGTLGAGSLKAAGGLVLAEILPGTGGVELAASRSPAAFADAVLSPEALAERVEHHVAFERRQAESGASGDERVLRLEAELRSANERLQAALLDSEARFRAMADLVPDLLWSSEPGGTTNWYNRRWYDYSGQTPEQAQGYGWAEAIHPEDRETSLRNYENALKQGVALAQQHRIRGADGHYRWFLVRAEPTRDETGEITQWFGSATDIHEQRLAVETAQGAEAQAKFLLGELQHRVRNTLAVMRSILRRTAANAETVEDFAAHFDGRLNAFARVQAAVTRNPAAGLDLEQMVAEELHVYHAQEGRQVSRIAGPTVALGARPAELMGLVLHELTTNAVKYGALGSEGGRVAVDWGIVGDGDGRELVLRWTESGVPLLDTVPKRQGFGTELFERTLAYELEGQTEMEFSPDGLRCIFTIPLRNLSKQPREGGWRSRPEKDKAAGVGPGARLH